MKAQSYSRVVQEREEKQTMDLSKFTTSAFAEVIDESIEIIKDLMKNNDHLGYTDNPYYHTVVAVQNSKIKESNKEIVAKFIYTNLFNRPEHRFYDRKGYSTISH